MPIDTDKFIKEVEARPSLWNNNSPEYKKKGLMNRSWKELCDIFVPNYPAMDSAAKNREVIGLQRKWKSLRDSFNRELKARSLDIKDKPPDLRRKSCPYFQQLSFLRPILEAKMRNTPGVPPAEPQQEQEILQEEVPVHGTPCKRKRSSAEVSEDFASLNSIEEFIELPKNQSDKEFFKSIRPRLKTLSPNSKMNLKMAFTTLVEEYSKKKVSPPVFNEIAGSSRTTPADRNGTGNSSRNGQEQQQEAEDDPEDLEDNTSDTSPGLSTGYTDESAETED